MPLGAWRMDWVVLLGLSIEALMNGMVMLMMYNV